MKNKKSLLSVLLAAVLLCACVAGMLVFGAGAAENTLPLSVGEGQEYENITSALASVTPADLEGKDRIVITLTSAVEEPASDTLFAAETIALPITVKGAFTVTANVATADAAMSSVNDFTFEGFTLATNAAKLNLGGRNVVINGATIPVSVALVGEGEVSADCSLTMNSGKISGYIAAVDGTAVLKSGATATLNYLGGQVTGRAVGAYGTSHIYGTVIANIEGVSGSSTLGIAGKATIENGGKVELNINGGTHNVNANRVMQAGRYVAGSTATDKYKVKAGGELAIRWNGGSVTHSSSSYMYMCSFGDASENAFEEGSILRMEKNGTTFSGAGTTWYWTAGSSVINCDVYATITDYTLASGVTERMFQKPTFNGDLYVTIDTTVDGWKEGSDGFTSRAADDSEESATGKSVVINGALQETFGGTWSGKKYTRINGGTEKTITFSTLMTAASSTVENYFRNCKFTKQYGFNRSGTVTTDINLTNYFYQVDINCPNTFVCAFTLGSGASTTNINTVTNTFDGCVAETDVYAGGGSYTSGNSAPYIGTLTNNFVQTGERANSFTNFYAGHIDYGVINNLVNKGTAGTSITYKGTRTSPEIGTLINNIDCPLAVSGAFYADSVGGMSHKTGTIINNITDSIFAVTKFYGAGAGLSASAPTITKVINNIHGIENTVKIKEFAGGAAGKANIGSITNYVCGQVNLPKASSGGVAFYDNSTSTDSKVTDSITNKFGYYYDMETRTEKEGAANLLNNKYHSTYVGGTGPWYFGRGGFGENCKIEHVMHNTSFGYNVYYLKGSALYNGDSSARDGNIYLADGVTLTLDVGEYSDYKAGDGLMPGSFVRGIQKYNSNGVGGNVIIKGAYRFGRYAANSSSPNSIVCNELTIEGGGFNGPIIANKLTITGGKFGADVTAASIDAGEISISGSPIFNWTTTIVGDSITLEEKNGVATNIKISGSVCLNATEIKGNVTVTKTDALGDFTNVYVTAPAGSTLNFVADHDEKIVTNNAKLEVRGWNLPISATLILEDRVYVKVTVDKELADLYKSSYTPNFGFTFAGQDLGINAASLKYDDKTPTVYYVELPATGASGFATEIAYLFDGQTVLTTSISGIAAQGAELYKDNVVYANLFKALVDYGASVKEETTELQNFDADALNAYAAEKILPNAARFNITREADTINFTGVTLLMGDTIGIRLKADSTAGAKVYYNDTLLTAGQHYAATETTIDLYINANNFETILDIVVTDAEGNVCLDMQESVAHLVFSLIQTDEAGFATNLKLQATAMLVLRVSEYCAALAA